MTSELQSVAPTSLQVNLNIEDLPLLLNELESIAPECYNFGLQLGVRYSDIHIIKRDNSECKVQLREIIVHRLKQEPPLTWHDIVRSLRKEYVKENHLANVIESKYITPNLGSESVMFHTNLGPPQPKRVRYDSPMTTFINYNKAMYKISVVEKDPRVTKWPPTPTKVFINLACIDRGAIVSKQEYDEITQSMVRDGNIDIILKKKRPITFKDIVNDLPSTSLEKVILVEGAPGVGKSTFAWEFCRRWERGEIAQQYQLVLLLRLNDDRMRTAKSLSDLIYHPQKEICRAVETEIFEVLGINILIILEGLDELPKTKSSIFLELIRGQLLPFATIMITSRPWATSDMHENYNHRISKHIEILGFTDQQITEYMESVLSDITDLEDYLKKHPQIRMCMYIPLNSAIVVCVYQESKKGMCPLPNTSTELYTALTQILLLRYLRGHPQHKTNVKPIQCYKDIPSSVYAQFLDLCELAYRGIATSNDQVQLIFTGLPSDFDSLGFMVSVTDMYITQGAIMSHNFLHLTIQEFLAAVHISVMSQEKQLEHLYKHKDGRYKEFLSGINKLEMIGVDDFVKILDEPIRTGPYTTVADVSVNQQTRWIFEAGRGDLLPLYLATDTVIQYVGRNSTIQNYFSLGYCIAHSQCCWILSIPDRIGEEEVRMFLAGINTKQKTGARVVALRGDEMDNLFSISAEGLNMLFGAKNIMSDLQELHVCLDPPVECCSIVWPNLSELKMLKLRVCDETILKLDSLLPDLSILSLVIEASHDLVSITLSLEDCEAVAKLISLSHCLKNLCIDIGMDETGLADITKAIAHNVLLPLENLEIQCFCDLTLDYLSQFITNSVTLQSLRIGYCGVDLHGLQVFFEAIHCRSIRTELQNFSIIVNGGDVYEFIDLLEYIANRIDSLNWHWNNHTLIFSEVCDEHIKVICDALQEGHNCTQYRLEFGNNDISDTGVAVLSELLRHNSTLKELDLSHNRISDFGAAALAKALHHNSTLKRLTLHGNDGIGEVGICKLFQALAMNTNIVELRLSEKCQEYAVQWPQYDSVKERISYR